MQNTHTELRTFRPGINMAASGKDDAKMLQNNVEHKRKKHLKKPLCAGTSYSLNKLFVFIYAFLYLIVGAILLVVGIWAEVERRHFHSLDSHLAAPIALLIIIGLFILINAILGIIGSLNENLILLRLFLAFTIIAFCVQIVIGVLAFEYRERMADKGHEYFKFAIEKYHNNNRVKVTVDHIQNKFSCCGLESYKDYHANSHYMCSSNQTTACSVPTSCCKVYEQDEGREDKCGHGILSDNEASQVDKKINRNGCLTSIKSWLIEHFDIVGAVSLGWAIPQVIGILLIYFLIRRVYDMHVWFRVNAYC